MSLLKELPGLFKKSASKWNDDHAMRLAASLAYYTAFSLAPLLLAAISVAGLVFGQEAASGQIYEELKGALGPSIAAAIQELVQAASKPSHGIWGTILAFILVLFGASGVFGELKESLNIIWKVEPESGGGIWKWIRGRFLSIGMVLGVCFLLLVSLVINAGLGAAEKYGLSFAPGAPVIMQVITTLVSLGFVTLLFALLFKYLPETSVAWRDVWIGALVTAILFTLGKTGLEIYISKAAPASGYGAAGALALVLVWVYYSAQIFLMGAEFTNVYATEKGSLAREKSEVRASEAAAAPSPITSVPRPNKKEPDPGPPPVLTPAGLPDAVLHATVEKLPALLGIEKGKKIKPLKFLGRVTGATLALAGVRLMSAFRRKGHAPR